MTEPLDIVWSRPLPEGAEPSTVTVSRDAAGRWFVSMLCEDPSVKPLPALDTSIGTDVGLEHLLTLSTGEKVANPGHERRHGLWSRRKTPTENSGRAADDEAENQTARAVGLPSLGMGKEANSFLTPPASGLVRMAPIVVAGALYTVLPHATPQAAPVAPAEVHGTVSI